MIEIISIFIAVSSLSLAAYSRYKQRQSEENLEQLVQKQNRMEEQIDTKEELRELSNEIGDVINWIDKFVKSLSGEEYNSVPHNWDVHSLWGCLNHLSKDLLSYYHYTGENPVLNVSVIYFTEEKRKEISSPEKAINQVKVNGMPAISVELVDEVNYTDDTVFCHMNHAFDGGGKYLMQKNHIFSKHEGLINQYSTDILHELEEQIEHVIKNCFTSALDSNPSVQIDPDEFEKTDHIAKHLFEEILRYEGIDDDLSELEEMIDELEEIRKTTLQTSYS